MRRVTRKDVAEEAGVTETIVSYVLNKNRYVDGEKKERVLAAVKKLGYRPSPMARGLKGKGTDHYLFIADDLMSEHFALIVFEIEKLASQRGYCISLCSDRQDWALLNWNFDGIIIASATMSEKRINEYIGTGIPVVVLGMKKYTKLKGTYGLINSGLEQGARDAVGYMIRKGRKSIAYMPSLSVGTNGLDENDYRYLGYIEAMRVHDLPSRILPSCSSEDEIIAAVMEAYKTEPFDAVFARTDSIAAVVMKALLKLGLVTGKDVAVIGVNNTSLCRFLSPVLTSVHIRRDEIAKWIIELLSRIRSGQGESKGLLVLLQTDVVERESV